jgi:hypothetical protein
MPFAAPNGRVKNYEPNSFDGPVQTNQELYKGLSVSELSGHYPQVPRQVDDFKQPGDLYRLMSKDQQKRLVDNIAGSLAQVSRDDIVTRAIGHFAKADAELGRRITDAIPAHRGMVPAATGTVRAIAAGVSVNATSPRGDGLLMLACYYGHTDAVRALLDLGAEVNQLDGRGQSPLAGVAFKGLMEVAAQLVAAGAAIDARSADGRTPLMMAAAFNRVEMAKWLIAQGASPDARDAAGLSAIEIARAMAANDIVAMLSDLDHAPPS